MKPERITGRFPNSAAATLGLWLFLVVFGGGCLALYYARIRYIPDSLGRCSYRARRPLDHRRLRGYAVRPPGAAAGRHMVGDVGL